MFYFEKLFSFPKKAGVTGIQNAKMAVDWILKSPGHDRTTE